MANYGKQTQGASFRDIEIDVVSTEITLPGGEAITSTQAYLQTTNSAAADVRAILYNSSDDTIAYQSNQFTFTDDVGGWKTITWPATTPVAGTYRLAIGAGSIPGGGTTVNIAYDTVASTTALRENSNILGGAQSTYPTFPSPITWGAANNTQDVSLYLVTSAGGGGTANLFAGKFGGLMVGKL